MEQAAVPLPPPKMVPDNIDYKSNIYVTNENRHDTPIIDYSENNKTITVSPPFINLVDSFPEYKILMYWEVKAV